MDEERAGSGSRDNRSAPTRALLGSYPYQTHTRRDLAITRAARVVLGAFWLEGLAAVAIPAGAVFGFRPTANISRIEKALCGKATRGPIAKVPSCGTVARSGSGGAALLSPKLGSISICVSQPVEPGFPCSAISRALIVGFGDRLLTC